MQNCGLELRALMTGRHPELAVMCLFVASQHAAQTNLGMQHSLANLRNEPQSLGMNIVRELHSWQLRMCARVVPQLSV